MQFGFCANQNWKALSIQFKWSQETAEQHSGVWDDIDEDRWEQLIYINLLGNARQYHSAAPISVCTVRARKDTKCREHQHQQTLVELFWAAEQRMRQARRRQMGVLEPQPSRDCSPCQLHSAAIWRSDQIDSHSDSLQNCLCFWGARLTWCSSVCSRPDMRRQLKAYSELEPGGNRKCFHLWQSWKSSIIPRVWVSAHYCTHITIF